MLPSFIAKPVDAADKAVNPFRKVTDTLAGVGMNTQEHPTGALQTKPLTRNEMPVLQKLENPVPEVVRRVMQINRQDQVHPAADMAMDEKEAQEREEAAQAYAGENEPHFVSFVEDCVDTSVRAMQAIRQDQQECWNVYNEEEPPPTPARSPGSQR